MATIFRGKSSLLLKIAVLIAMVCILLSGCDFDEGRRPYDYGPADWVCEDPEIIIHIRENYVMTAEIPSLDIPDTTDVVFLLGGRVWFLDHPEGGPDVILLEGNCSFSPTRLKVRVTQDYLFDGKYECKTLIFNRTEVSD